MTFMNLLYIFFESSEKMFSAGGVKILNVSQVKKKNSSINHLHRAE